MVPLTETSDGIMLLHIERIRHQATAQKEVQQRRRSKSKAHTSKRSADIQNVIQRHQVQPFLYKKGSHIHGEIDDVIVKEDDHHRRDPTHVNW